MRSITRSLALALALLLPVAFQAPALAGHDAVDAGEVSINGKVLNPGELARLQAYLGTRVLPGRYLAHPQTGCWINLSNGQSGCLGGSGGIHSRYGSGERNGAGDWSHRSDMAGGSVGGSGGGCVYAFGWSNC